MAAVDRQLSVNSFVQLIQFIVFFKQEHYLKNHNKVLRTD